MQLLLIHLKHTLTHTKNLILILNESLFIYLSKKYTQSIFKLINVLILVVASWDGIKCLAQIPSIWGNFKKKALKKNQKHKNINVLSHFILY